MNQRLLQTAMKQNSNRKRRKVWQQAVRVMAAVVVFCTTYALILPAITMQTEAVCGKEVHIHTEECYGLEQTTTFVCELPADTVILHQHDAACFGGEGEQICTLEEKEAHAHDDSCYTEATTYSCESVEEGHTHDASCIQSSRELTCGLEEQKLHIHDASCLDAQGSVVCVQPQVALHVHSEACLNTDSEQILICTKEVHEHTDSCYPLEEDAVIGTEYHCGFDGHVHDEYCYAPDGTLTCTIPEHTHDTLCLINNLDLTADLETSEQWEASVEEVELSGVWADDLIAVAESQLGYLESRRNCILYQEELLGYTRYGAWYGNEYGKWDDMFVSFCLNYAEIDEESMPRECDTARWINALTEQQLYAAADAYQPVPGDLVFLDTNEDGKADFTGILVELLPEDQIRIVAGDTPNNCVGYETLSLTEDGVLGYGMLPENPTPAASEKTDVSALLASLPDAEQLKQSLQAYQSRGDQAGFETEMKNLTAQLETISAAYEALSPEEKAQVVGTEKLTALLEVCTGVTWQEIPALTTDAALVSVLAETDARIESARQKDESGINTLSNLDSVSYQFTLETKAHDGESTFGAARVKVELVLPLTADKAAFDTEAMSWLEDAKLTTETRTIGEEKVSCQVLTGMMTLTAPEGTAVVVPGSFTQTVKVNVLNAAHNDSVFVLISAAMEHGDWNGTCWLHQMEEKQTIQTTAFTVFNPMGMDEQQLHYETFKATIDGLAARGMTPEESYAAADQVQDELDAAYRSGKLSEEQYRDLSGMALFTLGDPNTFAESAIGNFWKTEVPTPKQNYTPKVTSEVPSAEDLYASAPVQASTFRLRSAAAKALDSNSQVKKPGGSNYVDGEVYVSKTIEGTDQENVFDITLQIVTQDKIETVYEDPDMAVVIVTDISQTMNSKFTGETKSRYEAAMDSAEEFIDRFQQQAGAVSQIGYVAFNTHAHKIFELQTCETADKAKALATEMRNDTDRIMDPNQDGSDADYKASHDRFTNIEGGLKMAMDMLATAGNKNKFIVFLSDGFPTTYLKNNADSNTTNYAGYDPYTSSGSNGTDGVFYDAVLGVHCDYGTSYSDTAAIKAREMAKKIKNQGIDIFAIGVDVAGQTIKEYHDDSVDRLKSASTVERRNRSYSDNVYEIGHWNTTSAFENWLKGSATTGIGSGDGYYYSSTDTAGLHDAYDAIFEKIKILNGASSHLDWVVSDPMPGMGVHDKEDIEFIAFWNLNGTTLHDSITAVQDTNGMYNENTVTFDDTTKTISWDLKKSIYGAVGGDGSSNQYNFQLKYRVRLQNEESNFAEGTIYDTNDVTSMGYRLIEVNNGVTVIGDRKYIEFPIPAVQGYLSELNFLKLDPAGNAIEGAKFVLSHDVDKCKALECSTCHGEGITSVSIDPQTCISDDKGVVNFKRIPSGHVYKLEETEVPAGYEHNGRTYQVTISYDGQNIVVCDMDGKEIEAKEGETEEWNGIVRNKVYYELPHTGSTGTSHFTFGGLVLIGAAALMYIVILGRKNQRGGKNSR